MADVDLTGKSFAVPGVTQATNFTKSYAYVVDFADQGADFKLAGTHSLFTMPAGEAVTKITTVPLEAGTVGGTVSVQFALKSGTGSVVTLGTASTATVLNKLYTVTGGGSVYSDTDKSTVMMVVTSAGTVGNNKLLFEVDTLPAKAFVTKG